MVVILSIHVALLMGGIVTCAVLLFRRAWRGAIAVFVATPILMVGWFRVSGSDRVASWLYPSDTVYAGGFTEQGFRSLASGADRETVVSVLGKPLRTAVDGGKEYWYYSKHGQKYDNYWNMIVILDRASGRVVEKFREFYVD